MPIYRLLKTCLVSLCFVCSQAIAGISLDSTRIVFTAKDVAQGQSIGITSSSQTLYPYLVKAQVLANVDGSETKTPFSVTPSLFRLEPGSTNQIRILKTDNQPLPNDKESVFYLRIMSLPAKDGDDIAQNKAIDGTLTVSTGSIIKLFYRPNDLSMTQQQSMASLQFTQAGNGLQITNPSPYYVTLKSLSINGKTVSINTLPNQMLAPFSKMTYPTTTTTGKVMWKAINDYGGAETFNGTIK